MPKRSRSFERFVRQTGMDILRYVHLRSSWGYMKMADEIIKELWKVKDAIAKEYGCDVKSLAAHLRAKKREEEERVVDLRSMKQAAAQNKEGDGRPPGPASSEPSAGGG